MQKLHSRKFTYITICMLFLALTASLTVSVHQLWPTHAASPAYTPIQGSFVAPSVVDKMIGPHLASDSLTVSIALQPSNTAQLTRMLTNFYKPASPQYHQWLSAGQFDTLFAPASTQVTQVQSFLQGAGLKMDASPNPFIVQATGTTSQVEATFRTSINDYTAAIGKTFYQNDSVVQMPTNMSSFVLGVAGLSNTVREHSNAITTQAAAASQGKVMPNYGAGPGGSGLVPSQLASLYDAAKVYSLGNRGRGAGATLAVFELSGYTPADISTYEHQFFGAAENVPVIDVNVDGGPVTPNCPVGDMCLSNYFSGDIEVEADIETQLAIAPKVKSILVYNAPPDQTGATEMDEYFKIAQDDRADAVSSSWGGCEQDFGQAYVQMESIAFEQMALQGQSVFASSGDSGAYGCLRGSGLASLAVLDPSSQPLVTSVAGTSFAGFDPGATPNPTYSPGTETVWNVLNLCSSSVAGMANCLNMGSSGGGVSTIWGAQSYQNGTNVTNTFSKQAPYCTLAAPGQTCRQTGDVSANADEFTPYAEFCTGSAATNSTCAMITATSPGWFGIGGTSLSSPLWSGVIALWDSVHGARFGSANFGLYTLYRSPGSYHTYFHDITGVNQTENNNGFYSTTPDYDMPTGIGTPRISGIAFANF